MAKPAVESKEIGKPLSDEEIWAKICLTGNLAGLSDPQKWLYYEKYCAYLGLDPITRPFDLITTYETGPGGEKIEKTILYANASCSSQLAEKRGITYDEPKTEYDPELGTLTIKVKAEFAIADVPRSCWRRGVAHVVGMKGKWLENAIKKAETQAHRRATLALCGVAMPDESEIEDIDGAQASDIAPPHQPDADVDEMIGIYINAAGMKDSPVERGFVLEGLRMGAFQAVAQRLKVPVDVVLSLDKRRKVRLEVGKLAPAIAGAEVAEELQAAREKLAEVNEQEAAIKAEYEEAKEVERREAQTTADDPVAGLVVTLSETHQAVSDTVALIIRDYKKHKADILPLISEFVGRKIEKAADLDGDEAARVLKWLKAWVFKLEKNPKCGPSKGFDQSYRNHDEEVGKRLDFVYQRLTSFSIHGQAMLDRMNQVLVRIGKPATTTRYALDDEGAIQVCEIFEDWANDLAKDFTP